MDATTVAPHRRVFEVESAGHPALLAALDFGDQTRAIDLVFLHANGFNALTYRSVLAPLADSLRILAVDLQGHGGSPQRSALLGRTHWLDFRDDLIGLLDALGGPPVLLAGHSMGATTAILAAPERPKRVRGLVLFDPVILPREMAQELAASQAPAFADNPLSQTALKRRAVFPNHDAVVDSYLGRGAFKTWPRPTLEDYVEAGFRRRPDGQVELICSPPWEASNFAAQGHDPWAALERLRIPVHILRAGVGSTCSLVSAESLDGIAPTPIIETVDSTTHFLPLERPALVAQALTAAAVG